MHGNQTRMHGIYTHVFENRSQKNLRMALHPLEEPQKCPDFAQRVFFSAGARCIVLILCKGTKKI